MKARQAHDHVVVEVKRPASESAHAWVRVVDALSEWAVPLGILALGYFMLMGCMGTSIPVLEWVMGPASRSTSWMGTSAVWALVFGLTSLVTFPVLSMLQPDRTFEVRIGASWMQVDDRERVPFDQIRAVRHVEGALVVDSDPPLSIPDAHRTLFLLLEPTWSAWKRDDGPSEQDEEVARRNRARLAKLGRETS